MAMIHSNADFFQVHVVVSVGLEALNQFAKIFFRSAGFNFCHVNKTQTSSYYFHINYHAQAHDQILNTTNKMFFFHF
jgi:hypothetical protein